MLDNTIPTRMIATSGGQDPAMVLHRVHHQILRSHHLFEPMSDEQLDELLADSQLLNLDRGDILFMQGEPAHAFFFVIAGAVKIYRLTPDGQEKVFEVIGERQTFAEAMMLMDTPDYVASAQALGPVQLYRFSNTTYMRLLQGNSRLTFALLGKLCIRLHQRINEIETLSLKNATHRVVRYLLTQLARSQSEEPELELPMARQLIAGHLSIQPETFSRIIRRLIDEGIITQQAKVIRILDRQRLEQFE
jgi:CRP-like cAMP-binding protein